MKRSILYFLTIFIFFLFFGAHSFFKENAKLPIVEDPKPLRLCLRTEPLHLDPRKCSDGITSQFLLFLYDGLTRVNPKGEFELSLAESVTVLNEGKTYLFKLKEACWSNGEPLTAFDFETSWKSILDPCFPAYHPDYLFLIKNAKRAYESQCPLAEVGIKALDAHTLEVNLEHEDPYILELDSDKTFFPIYHKLDRKKPDWASLHEDNTISSGPFIIKKWESKNRILLKRNPLYWDKDHVHLEYVELSIIEDEMTQLTLFENKELDWIGSPYSMLPMDALIKLRDQGQLESFPAASISYYAFNINTVGLNHPKIRKALSYAINRKDLKHFVSLGDDEPALALIPKCMHAHHQEYFQDGDIQEALKLFKEGLEELGLTKEELGPITLSYPAIQSKHLMAQAIQHQWKKYLDLDIQLESKDWQVFLSDLARGNFQIAALSRGTHKLDPLYFLSHFSSKARQSNPTGWEDVQFKKLLDICQTTPNPESRYILYKEAEEILFNQMPIAPILFPNHYYLKHPHLHDVVLSEIGRVDFKWAYLQAAD